jgi:sugar transferase (PEP-CTERM/EpsH1 system associated)
MKILFIVPYVPNLVRVRPFNLIRALTRQNHQVTVLTVWTDEQDLQDIEALKAQCEDVGAVHISRVRSLRNCVAVLPDGKRPLQSVYSWDEALVNHIDDSSPYDVVHVEHLRGSQYGLYLKRNTCLPVVWDSVDCITHLFEQAAANSQDRLRGLRSRLDLERTRYYEGWLLGQFDHVLVTSAKDREALLALADDNHAPVSVARNGVDLDYFAEPAGNVRKPDSLIVTGKMSYHANIAMTLHLAREIMPLIWQQRPQVKLYVVGKDPTGDIQKLAEEPRIVVTGTVPDLPPYLAQAAVALAPLVYGAGIQNKVLEAMACGTPVVTSPRAVAALEIVPGRDLLVAEGAGEFATAVLRLLNDASLRVELGRAGREYVETHHNWQKTAVQLEAIYRSVIKTEPEPA